MPNINRPDLHVAGIQQIVLDEMRGLQRSSLRNTQVPYQADGELLTMLPEEATPPSRGLGTCHRCSNEIQPGTGWDGRYVCSLSSDIWCRSCHADTSYFCDSCARHSHSYDYLECRNCSHCAACGCVCNEDDYDEDDYEDRNENSRSIIDYSTNVVQYLDAEPQEGVRTFGIEIELEAKNISADELATRIRQHPDLKNNWVCKYDGSLGSNGVEVVSAPMTYEDLRRAITQLFEFADITKSVRRSSNCGTHIHVGRNSVSPRTIARLWAIYKRGAYNAQMKELLTALSGRGNVHWAEWDSQCPVRLRRRRYGCSGDVQLNGHYCAIAASSHYETYEMRVFSGSTRASTALRFLETYDMLLNICNETHGIDVLTKHDVLLGEIAKRLDQYPALKDTFADARKKLGIGYAHMVLSQKKNPKVGFSIDEAKRKMREERKAIIGRDVPAEKINLDDKIEKIAKIGRKQAFRRFEVLSPSKPKRKQLADLLAEYSDTERKVELRLRADILGVHGYLINDNFVNGEINRSGQILCNSQCVPCNAYRRVVREYFINKYFSILCEADNQERNFYGAGIWGTHVLTLEHLLFTNTNNMRTECACVAARVRRMEAILRTANFQLPENRFY